MAALCDDFYSPWVSSSRSAKGSKSSMPLDTPQLYISIEERKKDILAKMAFKNEGKRYCIKKFK